MKKLIALFLCILLLTGCARTYEGPTETVWVLGESTKEYMAFTYGRLERVVYAYDIYGRVAQTMEFRDGEKENKTVYTYDDHGNLLREEYYSLGGWFPKRTQQTFYTYDERDRVTSMVYEFMGENEFEHRYTYDDETGTRTTTYINAVLMETFDEHGNLLRKESIDGDGLRYVQEYTLREDGKILTERIIETDGRTYTHHFEHDEQGECIAMTTEENGVFTEVYRYRCEYDEQGRKVRTVELIDGAEFEVSRREYDDSNHSVTIYLRGEKSDTVRYDGNGREVERFIYDSKTGEVSLHYTYTYRTIQVPAEKEEP